MPPDHAEDDANWILIHDDDGNLVHKIDIDLCNHVADEALTALHELEDNLEHFDFSTAAFGMFVNCVHILLDAGWNMQDLIKEVQDHALMHESGNSTLN